jgi:putative OPT family oligopeptide transporter
MIRAIRSDQPAEEPMSEQPFTPYVRPEQSVAEFTVKAVGLGVVLALVMAAANTYLGLYAGMTVSASIPAAVISMGILRGLLRRGTILENNIVQTIASAGQSVAAGVIFTIPALVITGVWSEFKYWQTTLIAALGSVLGVLFMIPLRRALIVEEKELKYPEGLACAEVLEVGEKGGSGVLFVVSGIVVSAVFKFLSEGIKAFTGTVEGAMRAGRSAFYFGADISPALLAVGYIIGFNVSVLIFVGGALAWIILIPVHYLMHGYPGGADPVLDVMMGTWKSQIRYVGVGSMIVAGIWSIIGARRGILKGIEGAIAGYKGLSHGGAGGVLRTEKDISMTTIMPFALAVAALIFVIYIFLTGSAGIGIVAGIAMIIAAFFFVAVSSYICGLIGSSNNPVSGMTISTLFFASALLLLFGMTGPKGILAALGVAGVVCCAACTAGDISQDLKTGYQVGATPKYQQIGMMIGAVVPSFIIAPILTVLHASYGIGIEVKPGVNFLKAPQANLFASITKAMFGEGGSLPWNMVIFGVGVGIALIICDEILRRRNSPFRMYVMPVAVGIYLPWSLSVPILLGGAAAWGVTKYMGKAREKEAEHKGVLFGSGLIAGESLMGIVIAVLIFAKYELPAVPIPAGAQKAISILGLLALCAGYMWLVQRKEKA